MTVTSCSCLVSSSRGQHQAWTSSHNVVSKSHCQRLDMCSWRIFNSIQSNCDSSHCLRPRAALPLSTNWRCQESGQNQHETCQLCLSVIVELKLRTSPVEQCPVNEQAVLSWWGYVLQHHLSNGTEIISHVHDELQWHHIASD